MKNSNNKIGKALSNSIASSFHKGYIPLYAQDFNDNDFNVNGIIIRLHAFGLYVSVNGRLWDKLKGIKPSPNSLAIACYLLEDRYTFK